MAQTERSFTAPNRVLILFCLATFFFTISNGITSYYFPILSLETGISTAQMGLLYASSSIFGVIFDLLLSKYLHSTNFGRLGIYAGVLLVLFPALLVFKASVFIYIIAAAIWALYSNLNSFASYDFVATTQKESNHTKSFSALSIANDLGYVVAPLIATSILMKIGDISSAVIPIFAGVMSLSLTTLAIHVWRKQRTDKTFFITQSSNEHPQRRTKEEFRILFRVALRMWPLLLISFHLALTESVYWTITPLIDTFSTNFTGLGGILLSLTMAPSLFMNWMSDPLSKKFGKKRVVYTSFILTNVVFFFVGFISNPYLLLFVVLLTNMIDAITYPALNAVIADFLKDSQQNDNEIVSVKDMTGNLGYILGPAFAGIMLQYITDLKVFSVLAVLSIIAGFVSLLFSPKKISMTDTLVAS